MFGLLFVFFLVVSFALISVGVYYYIKDKERQSEDDDNNEIRIWGLNPASFYCISIVSLIILFLLYENPTSVKWDEQHKIDKQQNELIDSLQRENLRLNRFFNDLRDLQELHNQLDEQLIKVSGKRDVVIVNNRIPWHKPCRKDSICCDTAKQRRCHR